ncbi:MAG: hypothetical protein AAF802_29460 [Planctomycetota bacterium]
MLLASPNLLEKDMKTMMRPRRLAFEPLAQRCLMAADGFSLTDDISSLPAVERLSLMKYNPCVDAGFSTDPLFVNAGWMDDSVFIDLPLLTDDLVDRSFRQPRSSAEVLQVTPLLPVHVESVTPVLVDQQMPAVEESRLVDTDNEVGEALVSMRVSVTDIEGNSIQQILVGQEFLLSVSAIDERVFGQWGVFAASLDVLYDVQMASPVDTAEIEFAPSVKWLPGGAITEEGVDELMGVSQLRATNEAKFQLASIRMQALSAGTFQARTDPADDRWAEVLLFGLDYEIPLGRIDFGSAELVILDEDAVSETDVVEIQTLSPVFDNPTTLPVGVTKFAAFDEPETMRVDSKQDIPGHAPASREPTAVSFDVYSDTDDDGFDQDTDSEAEERRLADVVVTLQVDWLNA